MEKETRGRPKKANKEKARGLTISVQNKVIDYLGEANCRKILKTAIMRVYDRKIRELIEP